MTFTELENLLKATMGLDATTVGSSTVERGIRERMKATGADSVEKYWNLVCSSAVELQELVESVVVPETWFFRDNHAFTALGKLVREEWSTRNPAGVVRLLSVPCSTGEEPYSLAICLHGSGMSRFIIDAVDISERALTRAKAAVFGRNSFRGAGLEFQNNYFEKNANGYELTAGIRCRVNFERGNLIEETFGATRQKYDFIFCRNLLIYFDAATQKRAFAKLKQMLTDDGVLFVGPSEGAVAVSHGFVSTKLPSSFAFRKSGGKLTLTGEERIKDKPERKASALSKPPTSTGKMTTVRPPTPKPGIETPEPEIDLSLARRSADAGKLEDATQICLAHLRRKGASAEAYYLLGLVQDACNAKEEARELYRKAVYLQPDHYDALIHLSLLTASLGDANGARALQHRAERAKQNVK
ncbi:MAG: hypothetical protein JWM68_24 [Verrucomicrobiales bacterium]|nr:hypothetical protein [Verrucomicrobiales bacterium]